MLENGGAVVIPVILGLVEVLKRLGMPSQWAPVASLVLGLGSGFIYLAPGEPSAAVLAGLIAALSAMGLWSGPKAMIRALRGG